MPPVNRLKYDAFDGCRCDNHKLLSFDGSENPLRSKFIIGDHMVITEVGFYAHTLTR